MNGPRVVRWSVLASTLVLIYLATLFPTSLTYSNQLPPRWCVRCGGLWLTDFISNVVLFVPLGVSLALHGRRRLPSASLVTVLATVLATFVSIAIEVSQSFGYPPGRSAALADVISNGLGGMLGALLAIHWGGIFRPSSRASAVLAVGWSVFGALILIGTSFALSPRSTPQQSVVTFAPSGFAHAPGFGWYEDTNDSALVADYRVKRGWTGPIIVSASQNMDSLRVMAFVKGRDPTNAFVPITYVHVGADTSPIVLIGQHNFDAEVRVTRRAWDVGLNFPALKVRGAFAGRRNGDAVPLTLSAVSAPAFVSLVAQSSTRQDSTVLLATPLLGWVLIQSLVTTGSPLAPVVAILWLLGMTMPLAWWAEHMDRFRGRTVLFCTGVLVSAAYIGPYWFHGHTISIMQLVMLCSGATVVAALRRWRRIRQSYRSS